MAWTDELLANHAALSDVDVRFREYAMASPKCMDFDYLTGFGFLTTEARYFTGGGRAGAK